MNDTPTIAPMGDLPQNEPTENSTLDELAAYAMLKQDRLIARDKMDGEDLWLMGRALEWAFQKTPYGEWEKWWKDKRFKKTYVWQARTLHEKATLDEVKELGLTEALRKFAVVPEKKLQTETTKAAGGNTRKNDNPDATKASKKAEEPTDDGGDPAQGDDEASDDLADPDERPSDDLAAEEEREFKEFEASIRKLTPKTRAVVIHHALEVLREELKGGDVDQDLQQTLGQIARLAEELKGMNSHDEHDS